MTHDTSPLKGNLPAYKSSKKIDDFTVEIEVNGPYPLLLNDLHQYLHLRQGVDGGQQHRCCRPIPARASRAMPPTTPTAPGRSWSRCRRADSKTVFAKNPSWWDKPQAQHRHDRVHADHLGLDAASRRLLSGEIDFTNVAPLQDLPRLSASPDVKVLQTSELRSVFFAFNLTDKLLRERRQGQEPAQGHPRPRGALPRHRHRRRPEAGHARRLSRNTGALVAPPSPGYEPSQDARCPSTSNGAKKLLADAGYPNGFSFQMNCQSDFARQRGGVLPGGRRRCGRAPGSKPNLNAASAQPAGAQARQGRFRRDLASAGPTSR